MAGTALANFGDFMKVTGPRYLTSAEDVINEAVKNTYILGRFLRGKGMDVAVQSGKTINDTILFDESSTYDHYKPNATFAWKNPQVLNDLEINWRFSVDHMSWTDQEIELNVPDGLSSGAQKVAYKKLKRIKEMRMWTSFLNGMENDLWAQASGSATEMETSSGSLPYSIPSFISEHDGTTGTSYVPWASATTIMGINPASETKWRNQVSRYDYDDPGDSDGGNNGLLNAFDEMFLKVQFIPPATKQEYFEKDKLNRQFICCSRDGINMYKRELRDSNDTLVSKQDAAYNMPQYGGIDLVYVASLDTATINGETPSDTEAGNTKNGARYWWLNGNYMTPVYHSRRYMEKHAPMRHPNQPFTTVQPVDCWWNLFCNSRQRQGIIAPS
tara:strand:- start:145 stop:1302 length:1158 start_codon:yes stop_codon:yes gene_type:complete